jgi:hypothetical protein
MMFGMMFTSFYAFAKSIKYTFTKKRKILSWSWCLMWALIYAEPYVIPVPVVRFLACAASILLFYFLNKETIETNISAYMLSYGISIVLYYLSGLVLAIPFAYLTNTGQIIDAPLDYNQPIYLITDTIRAILQFILAILLFRIRRLKNGFPFIFKRYTIVLTLVITGFILFLVRWVNKSSASEEVYMGYNLDIIGIILAGIGIYILIRKLIKTFQTKMAEQNTEEYYKNMWLQEKAEKEQCLKLIEEQRAFIHNTVSYIIELSDFALEQCDLELLKNLRNDFQNAMANRKGKQNLPTANSITIDRLFEYFAKQFAQDNIDFNLIMNGSIVYMVNNIIGQGDLETLIANHLKNAQIAINAGDNPCRRIAVTIGLSENLYEFTVFDSGIPFEVDTLVRLGTDRVTTHAGTGGSGIGFETTFKTMQEYDASLIINEQEQSETDYSKSVSIRFDSKHQYIIETYRPDDFPSSDRYSVIGHENNLAISSGK